MSEPHALFSGDGLTCLRGERIVFAGLDFQLSAGGALLLLGPNGSGKSSLLRLLAGFLAPAKGGLFWNGRPWDEDREARSQRLGYVGHQDAIKPVLTVLENLRFWAKLHDPSADDAAPRRALERLGLWHLQGTPGKLLSAGQKRRLTLARLWAAPAPLWLLDEPTVALDRASVGTIETMIAEHRDGGGMVVLSTHAPIELPDAEELHLDRFAPDPAAAFAGYGADIDAHPARDETWDD